MKHHLILAVAKKASCYSCILLCFFGLTSSLSAQNLVYAKALKNTAPLAGTAVGRSIQADNLGNTYVTGYFTGTADFDGGAGIANLTAAGSQDVFVAKYDASGNYVFAKAMGGTGSDDGQGVAIDGSGNVYVTGYFVGTADFDPGAGVINLTSTGGNDIFFAKYDALGNYLYAKALGEAGNDLGYGIAADGSGSAYITGSFAGTIDFDPGVGSANLTSAGSSDIFMAKYDASGNYVYAKAMGGTVTDVGNAIAVDVAGSAYITGLFIGTVDFDPGAGTANLNSNLSSIDIFVAKYDASGNYVYARALGGGNSDVGSGIAVDASGNVYVTGSFVSTADFDPGAGEATLISNGGNDVFVAKYDASGNYVYAKGFGGLNTDIGNGIALDGSANVYVTGYFFDMVDFDPGAGVASLTSSGVSDIFIARYDASGNYVYARAIGSTASDESNGVAVGGSGNVYTTGSFRGIVDFDPGAAVANLSIAGTGANAYVSALNNTGNYVYATQLGNYANVGLSDEGKSIAVDALGNTYITGYFVGTVDFDPGAGEASLTSAGSEDIFIAKYDALGNYVYAKAVGGTGSDFGGGIAVDGAGSVYITGYFVGTADFDPGAAVNNLVSAGIYDVFVARYDAAGNYVYAKAIGGTGGDIGYGIAVDGSGNVYVTGFFDGTVDFDPGAGVTSLSSNGGSSDIFIARYDGSGNFLFARAIGGTSDDIGFGVAVDALGSAYVTGYFSGSVDFNAGAGTAILTSVGSGDAFVAKYDASGNFVYAKSIGGASVRPDFSYAVAVDASGNAYITGSFDASSGTISASDIFIARYDASGSLVYSKVLTGTGSRGEGSSIAVDGSGNVYITGFFNGEIDFDPGTGVATRTSALESNDIFIAAYNTAGNFLFAKAVGNLGADHGYGIAVDGSGNTYVTGSFAETVDFNQGGVPAGFTLTSSNSEDIFFAKYSPPGGLPVDLVSFTAKPVGNGSVQVSWSTASQTNNAFFEVQRSKDGAHFEVIGSIRGCGTCAGPQHYALNDDNPYDGVSYYRLKQVDLDNSFAYSPTERVTIGSSAVAVLNAYPNITDGAFELRIRNDQGRRQVMIRLFNAAGGLIRQQQAWISEGGNKFNFSLSEQPQGVYYISLTDNKGRMAAALRVIKK